MAITPSTALIAPQPTTTPHHHPSNYTQYTTTPPSTPTEANCPDTSTPSANYTDTTTIILTTNTTTHHHPHHRRSPTPPPPPLHTSRHHHTIPRKFATDQPSSYSPAGLGHGIAPHCARAATILNMIRKTERENKAPNRAQENRGNSIEDMKTEDHRMGKNGRYRQLKKRTNGSARLKKNKTDRLQRWKTQGITVGSINIAGVSLFKLHMILESNPIDILCLQETWLPASTVKLEVPGYQVVE
jgi:hypothetical protein